MFGSPMNGGCSSTSGTNNEICDGTSVLNEGILPALSGVSNDPASQWASELFTMRRSGTDPIIVSVVLPSQGRIQGGAWGAQAPPPSAKTTYRLL